MSIAQTRPAAACWRDYQGRKRRHAGLSARR
jgi:hypothetical protein